MNNEPEFQKIESQSRLRKYPDPILRRTALPVANVDKSLCSLDSLETLDDRRL
jgi:hypothetical protein